jgi:hypothetical protein
MKCQGHAPFFVLPDFRVCGGVILEGAFFQEHQLHGSRSIGVSRTKNTIALALNFDP